MIAKHRSSGWHRASDGEPYFLNFPLHSDSGTLLEAEFVDGEGEGQGSGIFKIAKTFVPDSKGAFCINENDTLAATDLVNPGFPISFSYVI